MYLFVDKNKIKLLYLKKTLLSQYETSYYEKTHQVDLLKDGKVVNTDILASAAKEAVSAISTSPIKEKDICLILPQEAFYFVRTEVPADIAPSAIDAFVKDKARAAIPVDSANILSDYLIVDTEKQKYVLYYGIDTAAIQTYTEVFNLINLHVTQLLPDTLAYFKLFEKTLRKEKKEHILYVTLEKQRMSAYLYDSYGPLESKKVIDEKLKESTSIEKILKAKAADFEENDKKINRIILSGENSENVRQDTFTKNVGVWTNPIKRIINDFYQDYLRLLISDPSKPTPFLQFDVCIGAFIFYIENRKFSFLKKNGSRMPSPQISMPSINLPFKEILIFVASFGLSFALWYFLSRANISLPWSGGTMPPLLSQATPTPTKVPPTPTATPTPTPAVDRSAVKIKILNGSGIKGKASEVKNVLVEKGYAEILTGNADEFDYTVTEIQTKETASDSAKILIGDIKDHVTSPKQTPLDDDASADIQIIVGTDFK